MRDTLRAGPPPFNVAPGLKGLYHSLLASCRSMATRTQPVAAPHCGSTYSSGQQLDNSATSPFNLRPLFKTSGPTRKNDITHTTGFEPSSPSRSNPFRRSNYNDDSPDSASIRSYGYGIFHGIYGNQHEDLGWNFDNVPPLEPETPRSGTTSDGFEHESVESGPGLVPVPVSDVEPERICTTCTEGIPDVFFHWQPLTSRCNHDVASCVNCTQEWLDTQLNTAGFDHISCLECPELLQYEDIRQHARSATFERYDYLVTRAAYSAIPEFMWCPRSGCESGQIHEDGRDNPMFTCAACHHRYCITHECPWHDGETCSAYDRRMGGHPIIDQETDRPNPAMPPQLQVDPQVPRRNAIWGDHYFERSPLRPHRRNAISGESSSRRSPVRPELDRDMAYALSLDSESDSDSVSWRDMDRSRHSNRVRSRAYREDEAVARDLQLRFGREEAERIAQREKARDNERRRRDELDAADSLAARRLHKQFENEERERQEYNARKRRKDEERQGEQTARSIAKACPQCRWLIQQNGGCDHMTCSKCRHEFCWLCLADYRAIAQGDNSAHASHCKHHRRRQ